MQAWWNGVFKFKSYAFNSAPAFNRIEAISSNPLI